MFLSSSSLLETDGQGRSSEGRLAASNNLVIAHEGIEELKTIYSVIEQDVGMTVQSRFLYT